MSVEWTWTTLAAFGLIFSAWACYDAYLDLRSVRAAARDPRTRILIGGPRWWIAVGNLVSSLGWTLAWAGFVAIGLMAITRTRPDAIGWALLAVLVDLALIQAWNRYARIRLRRFAALMAVRMTEDTP